MLIDTTYDVRTDTPPNRDPDSYSATLKDYHKELWTKQLPIGIDFLLEDKNYLQYKDIPLGSDAITHSYKHTKRLKEITGQIPKLVNQVFDSGCTIGGYTLFPSQRVNNKMTINQARGIHPKIGDRFDLTLECIRLFYLNIPSPLFDVFNRYREFFTLFVDFKGYVDFFLLQDLVTEEYTKVVFHLPHTDFSLPPLPQTVTDYKKYATNILRFIEKRNNRITEASLQ